jgi:hypothetical protein
VLARASPWTGAALVKNGSTRSNGVIRACRLGSKIGPLFADTTGGADVLFSALVAEISSNIKGVSKTCNNRCCSSAVVRVGAYRTCADRGRRRLRVLERERVR